LESIPVELLTKVLLPCLNIGRTHQRCACIDELPPHHRTHIGAQAKVAPTAAIAPQISNKKVQEQETYEEQRQIHQSAAATVTPL